ncbi:exodeoxyribonuclease VII large subunit [Rhodoferax sp.]|uniref:exodeoxyribonuclease VII large subunit n=1 Tax=Rhodoferax sp. TaxID=50421 RepID=UPI00275D5052|nr:exodeoxyribonuclease VII large subunit [Rhodoferax sp.]
MSEFDKHELTPPIWQVGALCRAIAGVIDAKLNPVAVRGELSGFTRAASGHCYFTLKDDSGQLRCAMFRRSASLLDFSPRDGEMVEVRGQLGVYEARGDLQLVVQNMSRSGQGALFEQFLKLKGMLEAEGLFAPERKRPLPSMPHGIGLVTSLGAAALHDVVTALRRRVPHIPVVLAPASVQGSAAPIELSRALMSLYALARGGDDGASDVTRRIDVILLVRGGGSMEDMWAFNDEQLARTVASSPVPIVTGVGHETDFCMVDFVADLRAPTPTAAAELVAQARSVSLEGIEAARLRLQKTALRRVDALGQRLDQAIGRIARPSAITAAHRLRLGARAQRMQFSVQLSLRRHRSDAASAQIDLPVKLRHHVDKMKERLARAQLRLELLDPKWVLQRGYAWLSSADGKAIVSVGQVQIGQNLTATLADGEVDLTVTGVG